jgi:hypothetical protein
VTIDFNSFLHFVGYLALAFFWRVWDAREKTRGEAIAKMDEKLDTALDRLTGHGQKIVEASGDVKLVAEILAEHKRSDALSFERLEDYGKEAGKRYDALIALLGR